MDAPLYRVVQWLYGELGMSRDQIMRYLRTSRTAVNDALKGRAYSRPQAWKGRRARGSMKIEPRCPGIIEDDVSGVGPFDHRWVEGPVYAGPDPENGQPAEWHDLVCEACGVIESGWYPLVGPT